MFKILRLDDQFKEILIVSFDLLLRERGRETQRHPFFNRFEMASFFFLRSFSVDSFSVFEVPTTADSEYGRYAKYFQWRDNVMKHPAFVATAAPDFEAMKRAYSRYADGTALIVKSKET